MMKITMADGSIIETTVEEYAKLNKLLGEVEAVEAPAYRKIDKADAKAGDFVKFEGDLPDYLLSDEYYKITAIDYAGDPQIVDEDGDGCDAGGYDFEVYTLRQPEEAPKEPAFKVGDYAKVVTGGTHGFSVGDIVRLNSVHRNTPAQELQAEHITGKEPVCNWLFVREVEKVSAEEVAEAELAAKFAKIGRKPGDIKKGDIVEVTSDCGVHPVGTIGVARENGTFRSCAVVANGKSMGTWSCVKLIAPVEERFDRE